MASLPRFGRRLSGALLGIGLGLFSLLSPAAAAVAPNGPAFPIDTAPGCQEREPDAAALPGGGFVTVWTDGPSAAGQIRLRIHAADRNPLTPEIPVADTGAAQSVPAVAALPDGRFMVVWRDASERILGRLFTSAGAPLGGVIQIGFLFPSLSGAAGPQTPDIAASSVGGFAVVWNDGGAVFLRRIQENGEPDDPEALLVDAHDPGILGLRVTTSSPSVAFQSDSVLLAYTVQVTGVTQSSRILGKRIRAGSRPEEEPSLELYVPARGTVSGSRLGVDKEGDFMVIWREAGPEAARQELYGRLFFGFGGPRGGAFRLDDRDWNLLGDPELLVDPRGSSFLVGWTGLVAGAPSVPGQGLFWVRLFNHLTEPLGPSVSIAGTSDSRSENAALAWAGANTAVAVLKDAVSPSPSCSGSGITAQAISTGCLPGPTRLCLGDGRFQLDTTWTAPAVPGGTGEAYAVSLTRDTGYFLFFGQENIELMVKVLDGRALNGKFWVFYGSLTDVQWTMTVTDLVTGAAKTYQNPAGTLASRGDTAALPGAAPLQAGDDFVVRAFDAVGLDRDALAAPGEAAPAPSRAADPAGAAGPCTGLCLNADRFDVTATWKDPFNGGQGTGHPVPLTEDSGYFWFFDPSNVELVVKVLDGRAVNGKFWVFYGALTNVEYDIRVRHFTGVEKTYHNPPFRFLSRADTGAFTPTCGCTLPGTGGPVCGKDFRTYASECEALCTGWVEVAHPGVC